MRVFVAIDVEPPSLSVAESDRSSAPAHLTLRFLGEVADERIEPIATALRRAVREVSPFDLTLEGVGAFPSRSDPRVVWVGATGGAERLTVLAARVSGALDAIGVPPEPRDFAPHFTLFRVRTPRDRRRAQFLLDGTQPPPPPRTVHVAQVLLKESRRTPSGVLHRTLGTFPLSDPAVAGD